MDGTPATSDERLLATSVAGRIVAVAATEVEDVLPVLPLWRPPTSPAPLCGFVAVNDGLVAVLSASALLGFGERKGLGLYAHIVRLKGGGDRSVGIAVDRAEGLVTPAALQPLGTAETLNGCATALFIYRDGVMGWLIDAARLVGAAERERMASLAAEVRRRQGEWTGAA